MIPVREEGQLKEYKLIKRRTNWVLFDDEDKIVMVARFKKTCIDYMKQLNEETK